MREHGIAAEARLYLFYGNLLSTVYSGRKKDWERTLASAHRRAVPFHGVIGEEFLTRLQELLPEARVISQRGDLIHREFKP